MWARCRVLSHCSYCGRIALLRAHSTHCPPIAPIAPIALALRPIALALRVDGAQHGLIVPIVCVGLQCARDAPIALHYACIAGLAGLGPGLRAFHLGFPHSGCMAARPNGIAGAWQLPAAPDSRLRAIAAHCGHCGRIAGIAANRRPVVPIAPNCLHCAQIGQIVRHCSKK